MNIYISRSGERYGPFSLSEVQAGVNAGNIQAGDFAWHDEMADWTEVCQLEGIAFPERRIPQPPSPVVPDAIYPRAPQIAFNSDMTLMIILSIVIPIAGIIVGAIRLGNRERQKEGGVILAVGAGSMLLWLLVSAS